MDPSKLVVGGVEYPADALRNTAGKRYAITSLKENIPPPHLTMCTRFTSGYGVGCTGANEFDCPYIHLDSNTPIEAGAQTALATATTTTAKLYYHQQRLQIVLSPNPEHPSREKLKNKFHNLYQLERAVLLEPTDDKVNGDEDHGVAKTGVVEKAIVSTVAESFPPTTINFVLAPPKIIVAIDPIDTKLRDDAISCEIIKVARSPKSVLAEVSALRTISHLIHSLLRMCV